MVLDCNWCQFIYNWYINIDCCVISEKIKKKKDDLIAKTIEIRNPMVVLLSIGDYDDEPKDPDIDAAVNNLDVDVDINNLLELFRDGFKYKIYPEYPDEYPNIHWTKDELIKLLTEYAQIFADNVITNNNNNDDTGYKFDGLIVSISCHGIINNILTSDYKLIEKNVIHRMFSSYFPASRHVPRVILYDCCAGSDDYSKGIKKNKKNKKKLSNDQSKDDQTEVGKNYTVENIPVPASADSDNPAIWQRFTKNPDNALGIFYLFLFLLINN